MNTSDNRQSALPPLLARYMDRRQSPSEVTLPAYLFLTLLSSRVKKRFFGGEYVAIADPFDVSGQVCEAGALIASRSDGNLIDLGRFVTAKGWNSETTDWDVAVIGLESDLVTYEKNFVNPPPSLRYLEYAEGLISLGFGWPADRRLIRKALDGKINLDDRMIEMMLSRAYFSFKSGVLFALKYPDRYAEMGQMRDAFQDCDDLPFDASRETSTTELSEIYLGISRQWARLCRPHLSYLLEESGPETRGPERTPRGRTKSDPSMTQAEYEEMGLPASLASRLTWLASSGIVTNPSLPLFLLLAYLSENSTLDTTGKDFVNSGTIAAAVGAIYEVGGVIGESTDIDAIKLLALTLDQVSAHPTTGDVVATSVEEIWHDVKEAIEHIFESYATAYEARQPGLLPLGVSDAYEGSNIEHPKDLDAIKRQHDAQVQFWGHLSDNLQLNTAATGLFFAVGFGLMRNYPDTFAGKHGIYTVEDPDPITGTYRNPQDETNLKVGSTYTREEQLNLCRVWAELYQPDAKHLFGEPS